MLSSLILTASLLFPASGEPAPLVATLNATRSLRAVPAVKESPDGDAVAAKALSRFAVLGRRDEVVDGWAVLYISGVTDPAEALEAWSKVYGEREGPYHPATAEVGHARLGSNQAVAYRHAALEPAAAGATVTRPVQAEAGDPWGFQAWLNTTRAAYGLPAVAYDANLTNWAAQNNAAQRTYGMGHHVMGPARRQNAAGAMAVGDVEARWLGSPAHAAALLDPTIRAFGIHWDGTFWTFSAY
jgi:hypothetical protein